MSLRLVATACLAIFALACSGDGDKAPTPTLFPQLDASPGPTTLPPPVPTQQPTLTEIPGVIWLIDVAAATVVTLFEDAMVSPPTALFDDASGTVLYQTPEGTVRKDLDGLQVELYAKQGPEGVLVGPSPWNETEQGCEYKGRLYRGVPCGAVSPGERWMTYRENRQELEPTGASYDLWVVDLQTGVAKELVKGLVTCTQCGGGPPFAWSASGRYLITGNAGTVNRLVLIDVEAGTVRDITSQAFTVAAQFSPSGNLLIRRAPSGATLLEDLDSGSSTELTAVSWPAYFDASGRYLYSVPEITGPAHPAAETVIADGRTGAVIATLPGVGGYDISVGATSHRRIPPHPVQATSGGFTAALAGAAGCPGTMIYSGNTMIACASKTLGAVVSPEGSLVVLARPTGMTGPVDSPTVQSIGLEIYDVIVVDIATGKERLLAQGALGRSTPPDFAWNAAGTHILVRWPNHYGP